MASREKQIFIFSVSISTAFYAPKVKIKCETTAKLAENGLSPTKLKDKLCDVSKFSPAFVLLVVGRLES
jgi:hypothetical protein